MGNAENGVQDKILPAIQNRVSARSFTEKEIEPAVLHRVVEAGRLAPSAKNRQPWRFIVIEDKNMRKQVEEAAFGQNYVGDAPAIIALCTTNVDYRMPNGQISYPIDIAFAASNMMIQAEVEGLGTCVVTTYDEREVKDLLSVPYSMRVVMLLLVGHPAEKPLSPVKKSFERIVSYNHW